MQITINLAKVIKYTIVGSIIYGLLRVIPKVELNQQDLLLIAIIIMLSLSLLETLGILIVETFKSQKNSCKSCKIEKMDNVQNLPAFATSAIANVNTAVQQTILNNNVKHEESTNSTEVTNQPPPVPQIETSKVETAPIQPALPPISSLQPKTQAPSQYQTGTTNFANLNYANTTYENIGTSATNDKEPSDVRNIKQSVGSRYQNGVLADEMVYTDYNHLPMSDGYDSKAYEYGDSFLPPEKWFPTPPRPPICVCEKPSNVNPTYTSNQFLDLKEFNSSRRITPPDQINTQYIEEKLNAGR